MRGLIIGLAAGVCVAASLLVAATGQAGGTATDYGLVQAAPSPGAFETDLAQDTDFEAQSRSVASITDLDEIEVVRQTRDVAVAVLDTGIDTGHQDLTGKITASRNFSASADTVDRNGHGTHIAGIIAAAQNPAAGIYGISRNSRLLNAKVADDYGLCDEASVSRAIVWAVDNGASVINVSLELRDYSSDLEQAVDYAWDHGALVIAAAGNDGSDRPVYPAFYSHALSVTATAGDRLAPLANRGEWVDVAAPGFQVYSTLPGNRYGYETGTSFAAAKVSGLAALLFGMVTDTNGDGRLNDEVRAAIENSGSPAVDLRIAHGAVDFRGAISLAAPTAN